MTDYSYINLISSSDINLLKNLGAFIRHHRLLQNKTQVQLAREAGVARSTLSLFEKGENTSLLVLIQLMRALKILHLLETFQSKKQISPLQLAKMEHERRVRAGRQELKNKGTGI